MLFGFLLWINETTWSSGVLLQDALYRSSLGLFTQADGNVPSILNVQRSNCAIRSDGLTRESEERRAGRRDSVRTPGRWWEGERKTRRIREVLEEENVIS